MRKGLLGSVAVLLFSAGLAIGQPPRGLVDPPPVVDPTPGVAPAPGYPPPPPGMGMPLPPGTMPGVPVGYGPGGYAGDGLFGQLGAYNGGPTKLECAWFSAEYLLWKMKNGPSNWPLAVQGTIPNGVNPFMPGAVVIFGGNNFNWDMSNGARFVAGAWLPGSTHVGIEMTGTIFENKTFKNAFASGQAGLPVLGSPFINELTGNIDSLFASGFGNPVSISGVAETQMYQTQLDIIGNVYRRLFFTANLIGGARYWSLQERVTLHMQSNGNPNGFFLGNPDVGPMQLQDQITARNYFYGGELGWQLEYRYRALFLDWDNRLAMGVMHRVLDVNGFSESGATRVPGGLFAATTNIGTRSSNEFGVIPQLHMAIGWQVMECLRVFYGFDFLWATSVIRPGDQIDNVVNPTITPFRPEFGAAAGTARPAQRFVTTDFYSIGFSVGLHVRF